MGGLEFNELQLAFLTALQQVGQIIVLQAALYMAFKIFTPTRRWKSARVEIIHFIVGALLMIPILFTAFMMTLIDVVKGVRSAKR